MSYIGAPITVAFDRPPLYSKRPHCPDRFTWEGQTFAIEEVLSENVNFGRRGRMAERSQNANMQPEHADLTGGWPQASSLSECRSPPPCQVIEQLATTEIPCLLPYVLCAPPSLCYYPAITPSESSPK